ncbi:MAG: polyketide synthase [Lentisphaerae bacterium]|nr:polyketide synthase [Lentisphaerota bacterium]
MIGEPIAIIGMGCRLPQAADPDAFWDLLRDGRCAITDVPASRWDAQALYAPEPRTPGKMHTRWGSFLDHVDHFDPLFFRIMPIEAPRMDPQHRLVLEVAWEALEHAAIDPTRLAGSLTGVYIGVSHCDHDRLLYQDRARIDAYNGPNTYHCFAANRLSYFLKLRGPSLAVDGACSSSLAAIHLACQSLRGGDCDLALAGGVNLNLTPDEFIALSFLGVLSTGNRGQPFAAGADGYVRGEGCGLLVLKRLADAQQAGDHILAVIRGSALNHNGLSNGITAPSGAAQEAVIRHALRNAGAAPQEISHVEAMGTGTALGDPMEIAALTATYGADRPADRPCWISSIKANLGHLEAASGAASVIKVILALQHAQIPPQLHVERLNPRIQLDGTPLKFPRTAEPWSAADGKRLAAVSAFGFGGSNAHLILEEAPARAKADDAARRPLHLLTLSATTAPALAALVQRYVDFLDSHGEPSLADICHTSNVGRACWPLRLAVVTSTREQLRAQLAAHLQGQAEPDVFAGQAARHAPGAESATPAHALPALDASAADAWSALLRTVAAQFVAGAPIRWSNLDGRDDRRRIPLPTYPFQRIPCRHV